MKKSLYENEEFKNVTRQVDKSVIGGRWVRSSRTSGVSIRSYNTSLIPFFNEKICQNFSLFQVTRCARGNGLSHQKVPNESSTKCTFLVKNPALWQYFKINNKNNNKLNDEIFSFLNILMLNISKQSFFSEHSIGYKKPLKACSQVTITWNLLRDVTNRSRLRLLGGDIEVNPGPDPGKTEVTVSSYNIRGLKEYSKLKRVLNKCAGKMSKSINSIFQLQETHLEKCDEKRIKVMWRGNYSLSPGGNKSRGCLTIYDTSWETIENLSDPGGRYTIVTIKKAFGIYTLVNLYAPNEQCVEFFENICQKALEIKDKHNSELIISGDFNLVIDSKLDSVNRNQTNNEKIVSEFVKNSFAAIGVVDSYRLLHSTGGYTWNRKNCLSRLDMTFIPYMFSQNKPKVKLEWAFDRSDHALLECTLSINTNVNKGPGLPKLDPSLLSNNTLVEEIKNKLNDSIRSIPTDWDHHKKWEYAKTMLRTIVWEITGREKKITLSEEEALIQQVNLLKSNKVNLIEKGKLTPEMETIIDGCLNELNISLHSIWEDKSRKLALKAKVKWFDEGEKSNKYFLNIIKKRQSETHLNRLEEGYKVATGQKELETLVTGFYANLYDSKDNLSTNYENFYPTGLTKLNEVDRSGLDQPLTLEELHKTVKTCSDSAPGPDGIGYRFYEMFWDCLGPLSLKSWEYSKAIGILPESQRRSTITLLPKEGKDLSQIGNWRPITLTNCDLKIYTKAIANRVSKVLDKIIIPTQTAYIPGRVVHDNLRMFEFYNNYCKKNNVDAILTSLDAKKAFDSVDHNYMFNTLHFYGFSEEFIDTVKLLYRDIEADILVNGHRTVLIKIRRCVKQGDAFSCALFIICIDPLLRNIELNTNIAAIEVQTPLSNVKVKNKTGAFADDVGTVTKNDTRSLNEIFKEYQKFSDLSGIELNETKTEVMRLGPQQIPFITETLQITTQRKNFTLETVPKIKICGIVFSNDPNKAYESNVTEKLDRLKKKLLAWQFRGLSLGGKILIVKVFGISQLIYSMQACEFKSEDLKATEAFIFTYLWSRNMAENRAPDRIKRSIMKQDYCMGGL